MGFYRKFFQFTLSFITLSLCLSFSSPISLAAAKLKIAMVSAEHSDFHYSGGLGHAVEGAAKSMNAQPDMEVTVLAPGYATALENKDIQKNLKDTNARIKVPLDYHDGAPHKESEFLLWQHTNPKSKVKSLLFAHQHGGDQNYFGNITGNGKKIYGPANIKGEAFGAWGKAVAEHILSSNYDVVVLNEWHTGFVAPFIQQARREGRQTPKMVFAVHNMGYTEPMPGSMVQFLGLPARDFTPDGFEYHGNVSPFKAGFELSDVAYAVSKTYAGEVEQERFSKDLAGMAQKKRKHHRMLGIMNGIDDSSWDPATAHGGKIKYAFTPDDMSGKAKGKAALQAELGLNSNPRTPIIAFTSRISEQKGFDYALPALDQVLANNDVQVVIAGDYDQDKYGDMLKGLQEKYPDRFRHLGFNPDLEHSLTAYADIFSNPPLWEPSGLNQMFAQKNGTAPVVSAVGGLKDSVEDGKTGYLLDLVTSNGGKDVDYKATEGNVVKALQRSLDDYHKNPAKFAEIQKAGMVIENSWDSRLPQFRALFDYVRGEGPAKLTEASVASEIGRSAIELNQLAIVHGGGSSCNGLLKVLSDSK